MPLLGQWSLGLARVCQVGLEVHIGYEEQA